MAAGLAEMVFPGVAVGIEVDHRQRPAEPGAVGAQQRQRHRMIAAEPDQMVGADQAVDRLRHRGAHRREAGAGQREVADVGEQCRRRDIEVRMDAVAQHVARLADGARAEARSRPVADRAVPGQAGDGVATARVGDRHLQESMVREEGKGAHHVGSARDGPPAAPWAEVGAARWPRGAQRRCGAPQGNHRSGRVMPAGMAPGIHGRPVRVRACQRPESCTPGPVARRPPHQGITQAPDWAVGTIPVRPRPGSSHVAVPDSAMHNRSCCGAANFFIAEN